MVGAALAASVGIAALLPVPIRAAAAGPTVTIPSAIDATGSRDVTAELNTFLATVHPGTTVDFPDHGQFRVEGLVLVNGLRNVTINGRGSTLVATTDGSGGAPPFYNYRLHWPRMREHLEIRDSSAITVNDLTVQGPNRDGVYRPALEAQAGFVVNRSRDITLDGITARATFGDGVYIVGGSQNVTVRRCTLDHNGRQGVAVVGGVGVTVEGCDIRATGRSAIDLEPAHGVARSVHIRDNRVSGYTNFLLAAGGAGVGVQDIWLENNRVTGAKGVSIYVGTERSTRLGIHVIDNAGDGTSTGYQGVLMHFTRFDGIEVRGNHQRVASGVTPVVLHNSCNATVTGNDFGPVRAADVVKADGDCTTGPVARVPHPQNGRGVSRSPGARRTPRPTVPPTVAAAKPTSKARETSPVTVVLAVAIGALAGIGGTLLTQWGRRNRSG
jgi:hypothetical protein